MDDAEQALAYANADFEQPHAMLTEHFKRVLPDAAGRSTAIDLGCGSGDITVRLARLYPHLTIDALDGAGAMLRLAKQRLREERLGERVRLIQATLPTVLQKSYDLIITNSLLHHLHDPQVLWRTIRDFGHQGCYVFVADLTRPADEKRVDQLVERYAADEAPVLRRDFRNSLHAAFTPDEIREQLDESDLSQFAIEVVSDRHLIVHGQLA